MFKNTCDSFLGNILAMREKAIADAAQKAIVEEHQPYAEQLIATKNELIAKEREKAEEQIALIRAELQRKIDYLNAETESAIAKNKVSVVAVAEANAKAAYDSFILGVGKLVDETNIK